MWRYFAIKHVLFRSINCLPQPKTFGQYHFERRSFYCGMKTNVIPVGQTLCRFQCVPICTALVNISIKTDINISRRNYVTPPQPSKNKEERGSPIQWHTVLTCVCFGTLAVLAMKFYKDKKTNKMNRDIIESYGVPLLGGDFELVDHNCNPCSNKDFLGKWILIYFGFTHCPDICPEELEKMGHVIDIINREDTIPNLQPVFISIDPERDSPEAVKAYIQDFHPDLIGLTGSREQVDEASRAFRVYYATGPREDGDYLVDHTVIMYLVDDQGDFCEYFGQTKVAGEIANKIHMCMLKQKKK